jgi:galactokinase
VTRIDSNSGGLEEFLDSEQRSFHEVFGSGPNPRFFFAPGRVNLMGAHTDYNGGCVMPTLLDRGTYVLARVGAPGALRVASARDRQRHSFSREELPGRARGDWTDYPRGVLAEFLKRGPASGIDLWVAGDMPVGVGLSSSASLSVALALALRGTTDVALSAVELASIALAAEREFVGVPCGLLDPYSIALGKARHVMWMDCKQARHEFMRVGWQDHEWIVVDSGVSRSVANTGYAERVRECQEALGQLQAVLPQLTCLADLSRLEFDARRALLTPKLSQRVKHVVTEMERTRAARRALEAGDPMEFGKLMSATQRSLALDYEVSCPQLDRIVQRASELDSVCGARLIGAGFGGSVLLLLRSGARHELQKHLGLAPHRCQSFGEGREAGELRR